MASGFMTFLAKPVETRALVEAARESARHSSIDVARAAPDRG
jgi:FixJ family two-component response regulator